MARVECPGPDCHGLLQAPFRIPGTSRTQHAYCFSCRGEFPELAAAFDEEMGTGDGGASKPRGNPEAELRGATNDFWRLVGFAVYDLEQGYRGDRGGSRQTPGIGDTFIIGHGITAWIEYKDEGNTQSEAQVEFGERVWLNGGLYAVIWPDTDLAGILEAWREHPEWRSKP